jgi:hypothetical protein
MIFSLCVDSVWVGLLLVGVVMILFSTCCLLRLAYCGIHCYMHTLIAHPIALGMQFFLCAINFIRAGGCVFITLTPLV